MNTVVPSDPTLPAGAPAEAPVETAVKTASGAGVDPSRCPLCGRSNRCAMELSRATDEPQPPCWCTGVDIDPAQLARIPAAAVGVACLCPACARGVGR
ncbi:MAG: cysteine-rich CWC family protein [Burkholderiaceae bacterium]|nr:cysteine-rich CWC family protein [Burkholderiaceae bacterium]